MDQPECLIDACDYDHPILILRKPLPAYRVISRCQGNRAARNADVAQLVEHHLAKVRVAGSSPVIRSEASWHRLDGGVAERRGSGLQSRIHGFESRRHLGSVQQGMLVDQRDWRSGSALPSHGRGHWFDPSIAHRRSLERYARGFVHSRRIPQETAIVRRGAAESWRRGPARGPFGCVAVVFQDCHALCMSQAAL